MTTAPTQTEITSEFTLASSIATPVNRDILILESSVMTSNPRNRNYIYNGATSMWDVLDALIDGDLLVTGSVTAERLNSRFGTLSIESGAIQSSNFVTDMAGWQINSDGSAEFEDVRLRGTLESANFDGSIENLSVTLGTHSLAPGQLPLNHWSLETLFSPSDVIDNVAVVIPDEWRDFITTDSQSRIFKIRTSTEANTRLISNLTRGAAVRVEVMVLTLQYLKYKMQVS